MNLSRLIITVNSLSLAAGNSGVEEVDCMNLHESSNGNLVDP